MKKDFYGNNSSTLLPLPPQDQIDPPLVGVTRRQSSHIFHIPKVVKPLLNVVFRPGLIGLSVVHAIQSLDTLDYVVRETAEVENMMTSVERTMAYTQLDSEPGYRFPPQLPEGWPQEGILSLVDVRQVFSLKRFFRSF